LYKVRNGGTVGVSGPSLLRPLTAAGAWVMSVFFDPKSFPGDPARSEALPPAAAVSARPAGIPGMRGSRG